MKERSSGIAAILYTNLIDRGFTARLGYRYVLGKPVKGFRVLVLDLVVFYEDKPIWAFYIGPEKKRRLFKYKLSHIPFIEVPTADDIPLALWHFQEWYIKFIFNKEGWSKEIS